MQTMFVFAALVLGCTVAQAQTYKPLPPSPTGISYANTSLDVCEIRSLNRAGKFSIANQIYSIGKNAFRNATVRPPTFRFLKRFSGSAYVGEQTYDLYSSVFGASYFDLKWLGAALNGTGIYRNTNVRKGSIDVYVQSYFFLYGMHEIDEAMIGGFVDIKKPILGDAVALIEENDHGHSVFVGNPRSSCSAFKTIAAVKNCLSKSKSPSVDMINGLNAIQAAGRNLAAKKLSVSAAFSAVQAGRNQILTGIWKTFVGMTLDLLKQSDTASSSKKLELRAGALAAFNTASPITGRVNAAATKAVTDRLTALVTKPTTKAVHKEVYALVAKIFPASVRFTSNVYACKA